MLCVGISQERSDTVKDGGATVDSPVVSVDHPSNNRQWFTHWNGLVKSGRYVREGREELKSLNPESGHGKTGWTVEDTPNDVVVDGHSIVGHAVVRFPYRGP